MAEYRITRVSSTPPRAWSFKDKTTGADIHMVTYKVMLEGVEGPVEVNKKPGTTVTVGDTINGDLSENTFSGEGWKFKAAPKERPGYGGGGGKDQETIIAEWAIGQAMLKSLAFAAKPTDLKMDKVEADAVELRAMVDRVKTAGSQGQGGTVPSVPSTGTKEPKPQAASGTLEDEPDFSDTDMDEPIDASQIPF